MREIEVIIISLLFPSQGFTLLSSVLAALEDRVLRLDIKIIHLVIPQYKITFKLSDLPCPIV